MVIIVCNDRSVIIDSVYADFDAAENHCDELRNQYRNMQNSRVDFVYVTQGYNVIQ
jgi:pyoverdine/dityrosine biosynthesis protein Dit1